MPDLPNFREWYQGPQPIAPSDIVELYERGFAGAKYSPEEVERFRDEMPSPFGQSIADDYGYADTTAGELVATWTHVEKQYPGCWPANAQTQGDCVSHSDRNAKLTTLVGEVVAGYPDEISGKTEEAPQVSPEAQRNGVLATEPQYRYRGSRSHGWYCAAAARVSVQKTGAVVRKNYPGQVDLTNYNPRWAGAAWQGASDEQELAAFDDNLFRESTELKSFDEIRDFLGRGFGLSSCGSEGFASTRDENGISRRKGSWAHAMAYIGADDRPETHRKYGGPLVLVLNSWGPKWNSGPRSVMGTTLEIPPGSFWARYSDLRKRSVYAYAGLNGWARKKLPDYSPGFA